MSNEFHAKKIKAKEARRHRAHLRVRKRVFGTPERPRLAFHKSLRFIYAQVIDDINGRTLAQASSREAGLVQGLEKSTGSKEAARLVGAALAQRAKDSGIETVVFDRGSWIYHGKVKALAEGAREAGLKF